MGSGCRKRWRFVHDICDGRLSVKRLKKSRPTLHTLRIDSDPLFDEPPLLELAKASPDTALFPWPRQYMDVLIKRYAALAGIHPAKRHYHVLKHSICVLLWQETHDLNAIQDYVGHRSSRHVIQRGDPGLITSDGTRLLGKRVGPRFRLPQEVSVASHAVELGADVIKADPSENLSEYGRVMENASGKPVLLRGGSRVSDRELLLRTHTLMKVGASGIVYGRNIYQHQHPKKMLAACNAIVHAGASVAEAEVILAAK